jgi:hypothetical protein
LVREAAERANLSPRASVSEVIRYALAVLAKRQDPHEDALGRRGPKRKERTAA